MRLFSKNKSFKPEVVSFLSKRDSFRFLQGLGLTATKDDLLWNIDPLAALENQKHAFVCNLTKSFEYIVFVNGSWVDQNKGGIGGFILSKDLKAKYVFSGPLSSNTPPAVEIEACMHVGAILGNYFPNSGSVICSDYKNLQEMHDKAMQGDTDTREGFESIKRLATLFPNINIHYITRKWNNTADDLSKQGRQRFKLVAGWCI